LARGLKDGAFSFNAAGGRCEHCEGAGWVQVEMYFLADLLVPCEVCGGTRFKPDVLDVRVRGREHQGSAGHDGGCRVRALREGEQVHATAARAAPGGGWATCGWVQPANQLSARARRSGSRSRASWPERGAGPTLYVLDEPTVGLHWADVQRLLDVLDDLTQRGDTVVLVEHNTDVVRCSDWVVDLGPDGGDGGGQLGGRGARPRRSRRTRCRTPVATCATPP
jgi:excinuclease ABC subunit A